MVTINIDSIVHTSFFCKFCLCVQTFLIALLLNSCSFFVESFLPILLFYAFYI